MLPKTRSELELSTLIMTDTVGHVQFKLGVISFEKDENCRYVNLFCFYWFLTIFIYCVRLTLMIKHYRVSNYLRQHKSHVIVAIV